MSRVGKEPIPIPEGTQVAVENGVFVAKGPQGEVKEQILDEVSVEIDDGQVRVTRKGESGDHRSRHGLMRALLANAVRGVSTGFKKELEIHGVGYRAELKGKQVHLALGFSHPVVFDVPEGMTIEVDSKANTIAIHGPDRQQVGQVAAELRSLRKPEPYKGKGIRYRGEVVHRKVGKAGATA